MNCIYNPFSNCHFRNCYELPEFYLVNNFDFEPIFNNVGKSKIERKVRHESTLTKQMIYFLMFTILNAGYLISYVTHFYHNGFEMIQADSINCCIHGP